MKISVFDKIVELFIEKDKNELNDSSFILFCNFLITICVNEDSISTNQKFFDWNKLSLTQKIN